MLPPELIDRHLRRPTSGRQLWVFSLRRFFRSHRSGLVRAKYFRGPHGSFRSLELTIWPKPGTIGGPKTFYQSPGRV
jgi:hypothetical protein